MTGKCERNPATGRIRHRPHPPGHVSTFGTKKEVYHGKAKKTRGGLTKSDLTLSKHGKVVSKKMQQRGKTLRRLQQHISKRKNKKKCDKRVRMARGQERMTAGREYDAMTEQYENIIAGL